MFLSFLPKVFIDFAYQPRAAQGVESLLEGVVGFIMLYLTVAFAFKNALL